MPIIKGDKLDKYKFTSDITFTKCISLAIKSKM